MNDKCSCVIVNYNDAKTTIDLVKRIAHYQNIHKIIVVDNKSTDDSLLSIRNSIEGDVILLEQEWNGGYGAGNNAGLRYVRDVLKDRYALIANPDVIFSDDSLGKMIDAFKSDENICVASLVQHYINGEPSRIRAWRIPEKRELMFLTTRYVRDRIKKDLYYSDEYINSEKIVPVDCVPGAMLMVDTNQFFASGGYDERLFLYCEETLLGIKLKEKHMKTVLLTDEHYIHAHRTNDHEDINRKLKPFRMISKSRLFLLRYYYGADFFELILAKLLYKLTTLESRFILLKKALKESTRKTNDTSPP